MGSKHEGIAGWLILIVAGLLFVPIIRLYALYQSYVTVYDTPAWSLLTEPGNAMYHAWFAPTFFVGAAVDYGIVVLSFVALWLLFNRSPSFPKYMIYFLVGVAIFSVADGFMTSWIFSSLPISEEMLVYIKTQTYRQQIGSLVSCLVLVPYLLKSKRVKATFMKRTSFKQPLSGGGLSV
ncbi:DUF2569 domain-containing protein [Bacillus sp. Marseille-Q3570]|uniref:DUF2569 domain-containing protein n=1 Tax=Bacillus sp. Marseille-Q3570 TaxID=2963522 RepID=UPI0021B84ADE|nr:DUF2569 domain-containing protein [Bacillus sp. Marseille-Q3570]